jgi:excisionase family DNA binding protein
MEEYLTVKDVGKLMRVSDRTVLRWVSLGRIKPVRVQRSLRFAKSKLLVQLEKYEYGGGAGHDLSMG